nr:TPA_asm: hypothetical protein [Parasteatoda house spider adintovirus]
MPFDSRVISLCCFIAINVILFTFNILNKHNAVDLCLSDGISISDNISFSICNDTLDLKYNGQRKISVVAAFQTMNEVLVRLSREFPSSTTQSSGRKRRFSTSDDSVKNGKKRARRVQRIVSSSSDDDDCMDDSYADEVIKNVSSDILNEETLFSPSVSKLILTLL